ncbi:hypothetical protein [uncultured Maribacter sp.]|uniref:hypothetical protein n=1 Tax=uncultured Maribacter sp. TaxID=431308 RepID=UPI002614AEAA|nr:hypothetical protein [uncultured Maribacter sp.]
MRIETLFSELNGFVIFDSKELISFKKKHINNSDILTPLTETNLGDEISANGVAIPIIGVESDDYGFIMSTNKLTYLKKVDVQSKGWIINSNGLLNICGIGYLKDFNLEKLIESNKIIKFEVPKGWLKIDIYGGLNDQHIPIIEIVFSKSLEKPKFEGDISINFSF